MKKFTLILKKIFSPGTVITILLSVLSIVLLATVFIYEYDENPIAIAVYVISAYTLISVCIYIPRWINGIKNIIYSNKHTNKLVTDHIFRAHISIIFMLIFNTVYAIFKQISAHIYNSPWQRCEGIYYFILGVADLLIFIYLIKYRNNQIKCYKVYRSCGYMLVLLDILYMTLVYFVINYNNGVTYPGLMIYAAAAYTFICFTIAIVNLVKYRKYHMPAISASKIIKIVTATVSLFMLQTAMLAEFYSGNDSFTFIMNIITGNAVGILILIIAVFMIVNANIHIKKSNRETSEEK